MAETGRSPDFLLVAGLNTGATEKNIRDGITAVMNSINSDPNSIPKIKLGFDDSSVKNIREQIKSISNITNTSRSGASSANTAIKDILASEAGDLEYKGTALKAILKEIETQNSAINSGYVKLKSVLTGVGATTADNATFEGLKSQFIGYYKTLLDLKQKNVVATDVEIGELNDLQAAILQTITVETQAHDKSAEISQRRIDAAARIKEIELQNSEINSGFKKIKGVLGGENATAEDGRVLEDLKAKVIDYYKTSATLKGKGAEATGAEIEVLREKGRVILENIAKEQQAHDKSKEIAEARINSAVRIKEIETQNSAINSGYGKAKELITDSNKLGEKEKAAELDKLRQKYIEYYSAIKAAKQNSTGADDAEIQGIREKQTALRDLINARLADQATPETDEKRNKILAQAYTLLEKVKNAEMKWTAAKKGDTAGNYKNIQNYRSNLETLIEQYDKHEIESEKLIEKLTELNAGFKRNSEVIHAAGKATKSFGERFAALAQKFSFWFSASSIIMRLYNGIKKIYRAVVDVDTAMTELKKVTNETDASYSRFLKNAKTRAKELGASLVDVVNASADFARLGYGIKEAEKLADAALVYKNIGDGIDSIDDASESIISTLQAFKDEISPDEVMLIVDKFNKVGKQICRL